MKQTEKFSLNLFEGTDKFDYQVINDNFKKLDNGLPSTQEEVDDWLEKHPEYTTTVQDKSLGLEKLTDDARLQILNDELKDEMESLSNGTKTVKQELSSEIAVERARIDNIIAHNNDTEGNAELIDIRTGANGAVYTSAGDAVRSQLNHISDEIDIMKPNNTYNWTIGKGYNSSGEYATNSYTATSDFEDCVGGDEVHYCGVFRDESNLEIFCYVNLFDENKNWISRKNIARKSDYVCEIPGNVCFYKLTIGRNTSSGVKFVDDDLKYFAVKHFSEYASKFYVDTQIGAINSPKYRLASGTDWNTITEFGKYTARENVDTMINRPPTTTAGLLIVMPLHLDTRIAQFYINNVCQIYFRIKNTDAAWSDWRRLLNNKDQVVGMANYTPDGVKVLSSVTKCLNTFMAKNNIGDMFEAEKTYSGIPYEDTHYYSRDAFFNFNLETVFSMFNNPNSLIYTPKDEKGRIYTGGVCSSFVGWILGMPIYYTTYDFVKMLNYKTINDLSDLEIGDVLICHTTFGDTGDHVLIVSNIYTDNKGVISVEVAEAQEPLFRTVTYSADEFWALLNGTKRVGRKHRIGRFDNQKIRTIPPLTINTDIISERGDNTYYEIGEQIFIQSTNTSIVIKSESGVESTIDLTKLPQNESNTMWDISSVLNEIGRWTLYGVNGEQSHITIIQKGSANLVNNVLTLGGYEGCKPCGYAVIVLRDDGIGGYESHDDSYTASRLTIHSKEDPRYAGVLNDDTLSLNVSDIQNKYVGYYVRVFYDTGCGQAFKDSNVVFFD